LATVNTGIDLTAFSDEQLAQLEMLLRLGQKPAQQ
jgi:hypothetical protein